MIISILFVAIQSAMNSHIRFWICGSHKLIQMKVVSTSREHNFQSFDFVVVAAFALFCTIYSTQTQSFIFTK